jgi:hypothetical protein
VPGLLLWVVSAIPVYEDGDTGDADENRDKDKSHGQGTSGRGQLKEALRRSGKRQPSHDQHEEEGEAEDAPNGGSGIRIARSARHLGFDAASGGAGRKPCKIRVNRY